MLTGAEIGQAVVYLADRAGMSQVQLALQAKLNEKTISAWGQGHQQPSTSNLAKVLRVLHCTMADLEEVAVQNRVWRSRLEHRRAGSVVSEVTSTDYLRDDELDREIGRTAQRLWDLLGKRKNPLF